MTNTNLNILILEDDVFFQTALKFMLKEINFNIVGIVDNFSDLDRCVQENKIDVFICDLLIQGEYITRNIISKIKMKGVVIICITATLEENLYNSLKDLVDGYLIKPFHRITLLSAIKRGVEQYNKSKLYEFLDEKYLFVRKQGATLEKVNFSDIIFLNSEGNYCYIHTKTKKYVEKTSLNKMLKNNLDERFMRVHHRYIINREFLIQQTNEEVTLFNGYKIPIGHSYRSAFKSFLQ
jgi:DNA-binding LytR/AlgR family response regulator